MIAPRFLLAIDMDGTLLRNDKSIAPVDAAAIRGAAAHGIAVTLATGRLTTGTLPTARELGLSVPLVCADGGLLIDPNTGTPIYRRAVPTHRAVTAVQALSAHGLIPFVFLADAIHCEPSGERYRSMLDTWSRDLVIHPSLAAAEEWQQPDNVALTVGLGPQHNVERASQHLRDVHADALDTVHFCLGGYDSWAVRSLPFGCDKGEMLARLAARIDVPPMRVAVIGDWLNDLGMFKYAGRSFAMGQAPDVVRLAATDVLRSTSATGGGVAEAIDALLASAAS
ncbi:MAG: HAD family phosphatase [Deltaproteobacteria bacterium]|nr:HAD family phosphatase [Deltaproteobacteria bacterium]